MTALSASAILIGFARDTGVMTSVRTATRRVPIVPAPPAVRGDVHIRVARCKGCALCVECCPTAVLRLSDDYNAGGYHYPLYGGDGCICCQGCRAICPDFAIFATPAAGPVEA